MLSTEDNELLTRVGPGTPMGRLLRSYWHPVGLAEEFAGEWDTKPVRVLGEDLVLFRATSGQYGLMQEACPHRGVSLRYGYPEASGIRCAYHGWLLGLDGTCREQPFEPVPFTHKVRVTSYPVRELGGLLFAYLGDPERQPGLPHWDILVRDDGRRHFEFQDDLRCNWLQVQENAVDVTHTFYLHAEMFRWLGRPDDTGFGRPMTQYGFQPFSWGILKSWTYQGANGEGWGNPLVFPNMLRLETEMHWRVPVDDVTTRIFWVGFTPGAEEKSPQSLIVRQPSRTTPEGTYLLDTFMSQDAMAWETAGPIFDRTREHLGSSDLGIVMFRSMLREGLRAVDNGRAPPAFVPPQDENAVIDLREWMNGYLPMSCPTDPTPVRRRSREEVLDARHRIVFLDGRT